MALLPRIALVAAFASIPSFAPAAQAEPPAAAPATDALSEVKALLLELDTAVKAKDEGAIVRAAKALPPLYKSTQDGAARTSIAKALGGVIKQNKMTTARGAALTALVETEDGKEAWKAIQGAYPADDVEDSERWNVDFVKAVGLLHPDAAIEKLLETFRKAKQVDLSAAAVAALGNYGKSKQRELILTEIVKAGKNMVPSRSSSKNASPESTARWGALSQPIGHALDQLTGDTVGDPVEWFKKYDEGKKNIKAMFKN